MAQPTVTLFEMSLDDSSVSHMDPKTAAGKDAFEHETELFSFVGFVAGLALRADEVVQIASEALGEGVGKDAQGESASRAGAVATLRSHAGLLLQMAISRSVDNFLTYLSELIALLYKTRPETLRANFESETERGARASVPLDLVLEHETMDELVAAIVERRVSELSYKGIPDLSSYLEKRLGFQLFGSDVDRDQAMRIVESRNVIVHSRGRINQTYVARVPGATSTQLGKLVPLDVDSVFHDMRFLVHVIADVDNRAVSKWSLPTVPA